MAKKKFGFGLLISLLLLPTLCFADAVFAQIDSANRGFAKAILANDVEHLVGEYTKDGCIIAPNTAKTCGEDAIRSFWTAVVGSNPKEVEIITKTAESDLNIAYATGDLLITDAESTVHSNKFVLVFKQVEGEWKLHIDSWTPQ